MVILVNVDSPVMAAVVFAQCANACEAIRKTAGAMNSVGETSTPNAHPRVLL